MASRFGSKRSLFVPGVSRAQVDIATGNNFHSYQKRDPFWAVGPAGGQQVFDARKVSKILADGKRFRGLHGHHAELCTFRL